MEIMHPYAAAHLLTAVPAHAEKLQWSLLNQNLPTTSPTLPARYIIPHEVPTHLIQKWVLENDLLPQGESLVLRVLAGSRNITEALKPIDPTMHQNALLQKGRQAKPQLQANVQYTYQDVFPKAGDPSRPTHWKARAATPSIAQAFWEHLGNNPDAYVTATRLLDDSQDMPLNEALETAHSIWK